MDLSTLKPAKGAVKKKKRLGRGIGSTSGRYSTKGLKGAQSRAGYKRKFGYEGGQMPLQKRIPKYGFKNPGRIEYKVINLGQLQMLSDQKKISSFNHAVYKENGLISNTRNLVKILGKGSIKSKMTVSANAFSKTAKSAIEENGGNTIIINKFNISKNK